MHPSQSMLGLLLYVFSTSNSGCFQLTLVKVVYGLFLSFGEVGPGNCLGMIAAKSGPTAVRGQYYGIAAAVGKVGAFVGTWGMFHLDQCHVHCQTSSEHFTVVFPQIIDAFGKKNGDQSVTGPFWVGSGLAILSALITFFFIRPLSHDGMVAEDREFRAYLEANGYDTSVMGVLADDEVKKLEHVEKESLEEKV